MNLQKQCQFYGVRMSELAEATGFTQQYVRQVLIGERTNEKIHCTTLLALHNRKEELLTALLKESA
tara:strand:- start:944 stop:1141 length:198 start_codon:yes stop_codon:yes gene_type:complete